MNKIKIDHNVLYCNGDSWACGDELGEGTEYSNEEYRLKNSFPGLIADYYNLELINSAVAGGCNHRTVRTTINDIAELKLKGITPFALITWTFPHRFELFKKSENKWINFNSPNNKETAEVGNLIWNEFSSDYSDLIIMINQVIMLESFLKKNNVPYLMVNIHSLQYPILSRQESNNFESQLDGKFYFIKFFLKDYLLTYPDVVWGPRGHPLEHGHKIVFDFLKTHIDLRFEFKKS